MTMWLIFAAMAAVAILFMVRPMLGSSHTLSATVLLAAVGLSAGLYAYVGSPGMPSGAGIGMTAEGDDLPPIEEMVAGLVERLEQQPDDIGGWQMLGRTYMQLSDFTAAVGAFQKVVELDAGQNAQTLVELGEAYVASNNQAVTPREIAIFENAVTLDPMNQAALFWSGIGASNSGNNALAADRWERLLNSNPPPNAEVSRVLSERIAEWRGEPVASRAATPEPQLEREPEPVSQPPVEPGSIRVSIEMSAAARSAAPGNAAVFLIARDPAQPSPPIAVQRRMVSELPAEIILSDRDSMVPGRNISAFSDVEIVARISMTGSPIQQSGDWFAAENSAPGSDIELVISERVE